MPEKNLAALTEPVVVVAHDLLPSDTATLDRKNVLAIVTEVGGATSHSAIIARSYEIPALLGVAGILEKLSHGQEVAVDALEGAVIAEPTPEQKAELPPDGKPFWPAGPRRRSSWGWSPEWRTGALSRST